MLLQLSARMGSASSTSTGISSELPFISTLPDAIKASKASIRDQQGPSSSSVISSSSYNHLPTALPTGTSAAAAGIVGAAEQEGFDDAASCRSWVSGASVSAMGPSMGGQINGNVGSSWTSGASSSFAIDEALKQRVPGGSSSGSTLPRQQQQQVGAQRLQHTQQQMQQQHYRYFADEGLEAVAAQVDGGLPSTTTGSAVDAAAAGWRQSRQPQQQQQCHQDGAFFDREAGWGSRGNSSSGSPEKAAGSGRSAKAASELMEQLPQAQAATDGRGRELSDNSNMSAEMVAAMGIGAAAGAGVGSVLTGMAVSAASQVMMTSVTGGTRYWALGHCLGQ